MANALKIVGILLEEEEGDEEFNPRDYFVNNGIPDYLAQHGFSNYWTGTEGVTNNVVYIRYSGETRYMVWHSSADGCWHLTLSFEDAGGKYSLSKHAKNNDNAQFLELIGYYDDVLKRYGPRR